MMVLDQINTVSYVWLNYNKLLRWQVFFYFFKKKKNLTYWSLTHVGWSKTFLDSAFHAVDSGSQVLDCGFVLSGICTPDSNRKQDLGFPELNYGFQSPGWWIPQAKISRIRILESEVPYMKRYRGSSWQITINWA